MATPAPAPDAAGPAKDDRDAWVPPLLLVLTVVTGLVDAVSYLKLGHVFVANMTGNVVFLGFALAGSPEFSIPASVVAIVAFLVGAAGGGRLGLSLAQHRTRFLAIALLLKLALVGAALALAIAFGEPDADAFRYTLTSLLALAMGLQNATARSLAIPDLTTTVLTLTLTGLAADSTPAGGSNPRAGRRLLAISAMFTGALVGGYLVLRVGVAAALMLTFGLLALNAIASWYAWSSQRTDSTSASKM